MSDVAVTHVPEQARYEARLDGGDDVAGLAQYQLAEGIVVFTHTEVDPAHEGRGVGGALARFALDDVRAEGTRKVLAVCPFIAAWIERHPEYRDLLYGARSRVSD